jgi:hypothetical protein
MLGQRLEVLHDNVGAARRADLLERAADGVGRRLAEGPGDQRAVTRAAGDQDSLDLRVQQVGASLGLAGVGAHVEAAGLGAVQPRLQLARRGGVGDDGDRDLVGLGVLVGGGVQAGEGEDRQHRDGHRRQHAA